MTGFRVQARAFRVRLRVSICQHRYLLSVVRQANVGGPFFYRVYVVCVRPFRRAKPVFYTHKHPYCFYRDDRAEGRRVVRIFQLVAGFYPRADLCTRWWEFVFQFPVLLRELMIGGVFRYVISRVYCQFGPLESLVASRVRSTYQDRGGSVSLFNDFRNDHSRSLPAGCGELFKGGEAIYRLIPAGRFASFFARVVASALRGMTLWVFFVDRVLLFRPLLAGQTFFPIHLSYLVSPGVGVTKERGYRGFVRGVLRGNGCAVISHAVGGL